MAYDGFFTAARWLGEHCRMARATAYEKLRVATELGNRPLIAAAFRSRADAALEMARAALAASGKRAAGADRYMVHLAVDARDLLGDHLDATGERAALRRDRGTCRIPGCENTYVDIHHIRWASEGGPTDIANAMCCCDRHHSHVHRRELVVTGDANSTVCVRPADGRVVGFSDRPTALPRL